MSGYSVQSITSLTVLRHQDKSVGVTHNVDVPIGNVIDVENRLMQCTSTVTCSAHILTLKRSCKASNSDLRNTNRINNTIYIFI